MSKTENPSAGIITPDKVLYIGGRNADELPDEMVKIVAFNVLGIALDSGCAKIVVKRRRWSTEFSVKDLLVELGPGAKQSHLGPSMVQAERVGSWKDTVNF